jgi:hypothetical protein
MVRQSQKERKNHIITDSNDLKMSVSFYSKQRST